MKADVLIIYLVFLALVAWTLSEVNRRRAVFKRTLSEWNLDAIGLTIHGTLIPLFQTWIVFRALAFFFPGGKGFLVVPAWFAFLLNFVVVDYLYYWNHRWLHSRALWRFHSVHHSGETFDVFTTSRNSAWVSFLILYVWVNGFFLYALHHPEPYAWAVALSNALDLIRHSRLGGVSKVFPFSWFISPRAHAWHHSQDKYGINFGGNFNLWDRWHGTYYCDDKFPSRIGTRLKERNLWRAFWRGSL